MRTIRPALGLLAALAVLLGLSPAPATAAPPALITVPSVQQWTPAGKGEFRWHGRQIEVASGSAELARVANTFADDIADETGRRPKVRTLGKKPSPGSIVLALAPIGKGAESYTLQIDKSLVITGSTPHGAFNGTRTVLQLLHQSTRIPTGRVLDWPDKEVRSVLMDNTPRHLSLHWWENFFKQMSYLKLNDTNLYVDGVGLDAAEIRAIDALANRYYVKLVGQLNMPSHMNQILPAHPEYQLVNTDGTKNPTALDLTNPKAVEWALSHMESSLDLFSGDEWHLGSDEFPGWPGTGANHPQLDAYAKQRFGADATFNDLFADFQNRANAIVKSHGKKMRVWNDMVRSSKVVKLDTDVTVEYWIEHPALPGLLSANEIAQRGNPLINAHIDFLYYDQSRRNLDPQEIYNDFNANLLPYRSQVPGEHVRGARVCVWLAWIYTPMESDAEVLHNLLPSMRSLAQVTWGSPKLADTYKKFRWTAAAIGEPAGLNPDSYNTIQPDPATGRNADSTVAYFARDAKGVLWTGKQSRPGITHFSQKRVATGVTGDPVVTALADKRLRVVAPAGPNGLVVATQTAPNAETFATRSVMLRVSSEIDVEGDTVVVVSNRSLVAVDLATGRVTRLANQAMGNPSLTRQGDSLVASVRTAKGLVIARSTGGAWATISDNEKLASDPIVLAASTGTVVVGATPGGDLMAGAINDKSVAWTKVDSGVTGQPDAAVSATGVAHVTAHTTRGGLMHAIRTDTTWQTEGAFNDIVGDPSLGFDGEGRAVIFAPTGREALLVTMPKSDGTFDWALLAESTVGGVAATWDSRGWPIYFTATTYGDLQTGTKWGGIWDWGRDFAIGTMASPIDDLAPGAFTRILLMDDFITDSSSRYTVLRTSPSEAAPEPVIGNGTLGVSGTSPFYTTVVSDVPVASGDTTIITSVEELKGGTKQQNTIMLGFVRDARNYSVMWYSAIDNRLGFDTVSDGRLTPNGGAGNVPIVVDPGDRLAVTLTGNWMTAYVERNGVWHRAHTAVANGHDDLTDPSVRARYRYAVALRGTNGTIKFGELVAAAK